MIKIVFALLTLSTTSAVANDLAEWNPPSQYDRPYHGQLIERSLSPHLVDGACQSLFAKHGFKSIGGKMRGCAYHKDNTCWIIYINKQHGKSSPAAVRRHEIGHCNGWQANHSED